MSEFIELTSVDGLVDGSMRQVDLEGHEFLVAKIEEGYDVVGGWRQGRQDNDNFFRTMPSKIVNAITRKTTGVKLHDYGCMLRAYGRDVVDAMLLWSLLKAPGFSDIGPDDDETPRGASALSIAWR